MSIILEYPKEEIMVRRVWQKRKFFLWAAGIALVALFLGVWAFATTSVPNFDSLENRKIIQSTKIYDRTGKILLYDIHGEIQRTVIPFDKIPAHAKNATIAIEDQNFYSHFGVSPSGIVRAIFVNLFSGELKQGGSTITQQLVKQTFLTPEKTFIRKIQEIVLALKIEARYSKDEILAFYLNEIPYGSSAYGIEAASQTYFAKPAEHLTVAEASYLAAMLQAPTRYSPYGSHRDELEGRKRLVLGRLFEKGQITKGEYKNAENENVKLASRSVSGIRAPHFSLYVKEYLVEKYGEDVVEKGGLRVTTTLNWDWQERLEELAKNSAAENEKNFSAYNVGAVATDPKTGQILVMIGSRDYFANPRPEGCTPGVDCKFDPQVNMTLRSRQPGSSIKPLVYAAAFKKGYTPDTVVFDLPTEFSAYCSPSGVPDPGVDPERCYHPENFDNKFRGPISLKEALAQSVNVASVKVLYLAGLLDSLKLAREMGLSTLNDPDRYGLTLVLGGGEVRPLELTNAYGVFANDGAFLPSTPILRVEDSRGNVLEEYKEGKNQVLDPNIARMISDILSDNQARAPAFTENSALYIPERKVAVKTGTTQDTRDAWVIGYTPNIALGVWAGNNDNSVMERKVAGLIVAPILKKALEEIILKDLPEEDFAPPEIPRPVKPALRGEWRGGRVYKIDKISGKLANEFTPEELIEERVVKEVHTILYWVDKNDPLGLPPQNPLGDSQFRNWEASIRAWAVSRGLSDETGGIIPGEYDDVHRPEYFPRAEIILESGGNAPSGTRVRARVLAEGKFPIEQVDIFLNAEYKGSYKIQPFEFPVTVEGIPGEEIKITAIVYDNVGNKTATEKVIRISEN